MIKNYSQPLKPSENPTSKHKGKHPHCLDCKRNGKINEPCHRLTLSNLHVTMLYVKLKLDHIVI